MQVSQSDAKLRYGEIVNNVWANEAKFCVLLNLPDAVSAALINVATGQPTKHIYCNKDIAPSLLRAFCNVQDRGLVSQLKTFDGCFCLRDIRGIPGQLSAHSYACAVDINAATNQLGTPGDISPELAQCFIDEGFFWGKDFHRQDPMHFSFLGF